MIQVTLLLLLLTSEPATSFRVHSNVPHRMHRFAANDPYPVDSYTTTSPASATIGTNPCKIKVIGVGGAGGNAVKRMQGAGLQGPEFWAVNTDLQALSDFKNTKVNTLHIGQDITKGLGAGSIPANGRLAAESNRREISKMVENVDLVFVTAGMGGGTGSGAAPLIAEMAKKAGALTVGIVTKPFAFEGKPRKKQAQEALESLKAEVDTLITVSNDRLLRVIPSETSLDKAFAVADDVLRQAVAGVSEIIMKPGLINVDFADVKSIMSQAGTALMGVGKGSGKNRARDAAISAISSPLLDFPIQKAKGVMFNIVGGKDLQLQEVDEAADIIYDAVDTNANIIFGATIDDTPSSTEEITITVIATGFPDDEIAEPFEKLKGAHKTQTSMPIFFRRLASMGRNLYNKQSKALENKRDMPGSISGSPNKKGNTTAAMIARARGGRGSGPAKE